ncbi:MAG TPA: ATP-binding cassette domain-containing protein [Candidatus Thermoplasmatota archaeon]|nr:ATP-binding cassette domain-containing protein [Candidatus Thermoplasmatota archaeon]
MTAAIQTRQLVKHYGDVKAVDGVDLNVERGELYGFLGPNGAGKTTTISILSTMLKPTSGEARVAGLDVLTQSYAVRKRIGIVFQDPSLDEELTGRENMVFHARLYKVPRAERDRRIDDLLAMVDLRDRQNSRVKEYSGGMRRRLELARGLLHNPEVLFLDEPTLGLDPQTRNHIWDYIRRLNKERGVTMMLTTHYMEEADMLCNRIGIIDKGRIVAEGTPAELKAQLGGDLVYVEVEGANGKVPDAIKALPFVRSAIATTSGVQLEVQNGESAIPKILDAVRGSGGVVQSINLKKPTLNDVFVKHTGRQIRDEDMDAPTRMRFFMRHRRR